MSYEDFSDTVKAALYDRLRTPFFASFLVTWLCWNWDFLYFLLESEALAGTTIRDASGYIDWSKGFWYPLISSLLVFSFGGLLNLLYYWIRLGLRKIRITTLDKRDTITVDQRDKLIDEHIKNRKNLNDRVAELHDEISEVRLANDELKRQNETLILELTGLKSRPSNREGNSNNNNRLPESSYSSPEATTDPILHNLSPAYALNETIVAKDGTFETISAKILSEPNGTVMAWFEVTKDHNEGVEESYQYILAHNGDFGQRVVVGGSEVYRNTWAILRRKGKAPQWKFATSNKNGTSGSDKLVDRRTLTPGWHSIAIAWSKEAAIIEFFVDGKLKGTDALAYWPDDIESTMSVGTWPVQTKRSFDFNGKVGPVYCYSRQLSEAEIRRIDLERHLDLHNLEQYFPGTWELKYENNGKIGYDKNVQIRNGSEYYVNGTLQFILNNISGNLDEGLLMFTKRRVNGPPDLADNRLRILELGKKYVGEENGGFTKVEYYRID